MQSEKNSWAEINERYQEILIGSNDDSDLWPNGRDTDAEDEDGI